MVGVYMCMHILVPDVCKGSTSTSTRPCSSLRRSIHSPLIGIIQDHQALAEIGLVDRKVLSPHTEQGVTRLVYQGLLLLDKPRSGDEGLNVKVSDTGEARRGAVLVELVFNEFGDVGLTGGYRQGQDEENGKSKSPHLDSMMRYSNIYHDVYINIDCLRGVWRGYIDGQLGLYHQGWCNSQHMAWSTGVDFDQEL